MYLSPLWTELGKRKYIKSNKDIYLFIADFSKRLPYQVSPILNKALQVINYDSTRRNQLQVQVKISPTPQAHKGGGKGHSFTSALWLIKFYTLKRIRVSCKTVSIIWFKHILRNTTTDYSYVHVEWLYIYREIDNSPAHKVKIVL